MSKSNAEILIFRHGQTDWNKEGRIQGQLDIPLNEMGRKQVQVLIPPMRRARIEALLSSDLRRASDSARIISEALDLPLFQDKRLRETFLGKAEGLTRSELYEKFGDLFLQRLDHRPLSDADVLQLGSESGKEVLDRTLSALQDFFRKHSYRKIGLCSHGGVIRRLLQHALNQESFPPPITNATLYTMRFDPESKKLELETYSKLI